MRHNRDQHGTAGVLSRRDGSAYAVPLSVLEAHQATPEQRASLVTTRDSTGFAAPTDAPIFVPTAAALAPYRLADEEWEALVARRADDGEIDDVTGHQYIGRFPPTVTVRTPLNQGLLLAFGVTTLHVSPLDARNPNVNRDANYYPPLH